MTYKFIEFEGQETPNPKSSEEYDVLEAQLKQLLEDCDFIVTNYGTMYPADSRRVAWGHRGPTLEYTKGNMEFDWWYTITGGYKLEK